MPKSDDRMTMNGPPLTIGRYDSDRPGSFHCGYCNLTWHGFRDEKEAADALRRHNEVCSGFRAEARRHGALP